MKLPLKPLTLPLTLLFILVQLSCKDDNGITTDCIQIACTEQYVSLVVSVVDSQSQAVALDSYKVVLTENDKDITPKISDSHLDAMREKGNYIVFSDAYAEEYRNKNTVIRFTGFINAEEVASSDFTVGADCCHVLFISSNTTIIID